ncbi:glycerol-3-phosphate acyltransferase PlsY [Anaerolineales bacterium]|nr:glycerol-3-phosphate acyltransferase PlsY [Anaerolineales bacterium]
MKILLITNTLVTFLGSYILGAIPFGLLLVRWKTGQDVRLIGSGRTGTTNALRAAGPAIAILTLLLDVFKGASAVWLAHWLTPDNAWLEILAPLAAILGHNYSIFLTERDEDGRLRLRGGAGGAPALGGALGLWPTSFLILIPISILIYFGVGYASVTTMTVPLIAIILFAIRAWQGYSPWVYVLYCLIVEALLLWALRPNIRNLIDGTERGVGWRAKIKGTGSEKEGKRSE